MTTQKQLLDKLESVVNQRMEAPTNPYGGQCVSLIDNILQYQGLYKLNFSYVNAIDCLDRAANLGLKVTRFNGSNNPPIGAVFVSNCWPYHELGHIGFVVANNPDGTITSMEMLMLCITADGHARLFAIYLVTAHLAMSIGKHRRSKCSAGLNCHLMHQKQIL